MSYRASEEPLDSGANFMNKSMDLSTAMKFIKPKYIAKSTLRSQMHSRGQLRAKK